MKKRLNGILTLFLAFVVQLTFAQQKNVTGTVIDEQGLPLPGVNVIIQGTSTGTQTDFDGNYNIIVDEGNVLVFSYVGFANQTIRIGAANIYNVTLAEDAAALDEVVVVGYGTATRQSFAGTASTIDTEKLEAKNFSNVSQALAGEVAGVNVINTSGQPGTASTIRIRGFGSVNGNRDPLYVVDGVPFSGSINSINPADIKATTILKDATATAIYGSRGANGVVLITTKTGTSGESFIEVDVKTGFNDQLIPRYDVLRSPEEYVGYVWEGIYNRGVATGAADPVAYANARLFSDNYIPAGYNMWQTDAAGLIDPETRSVRDGVARRYTPERYEDLAFQQAIRTESNIRFGGGDEKTQYFTSIGYLDDNGYSLNSGYDRYTARLNVNSQVKDWLKVGANLGYAYSETMANGQIVGSENLFEFADKMAPIFPVFLRDDDGNLVPDPIFGGNQYDYGSDSGLRARPNANNLNPIGSALYDRNFDKRHELNANFSLDVDITENLRFETRFGAQYYMNRGKDFRNPFYGGGRSTGGDLFAADTEVLTTNFLQLLRYTNQWGIHGVEALVAHESNEFERSYASQYKGLSVAPDIYELNNFVDNLQPPTGYSEGRALESFFGQLNYNFDKKYYFTGSVRRDGSSRFVNEKWGTFGSAGVAWVASNEDFLRGADWLSFLKLKASYGITGDEAVLNSNGTPNYYPGFDTFDLGILGGGISIRQRANGNPNFTWETSKMFQTGVEFSVGTWLDAAVDYYIKDTDNLAFERRVGPSQGIAIINVNDGELRNAGLEFNVTGRIIQSQDFNLSLNVNGEVLSNEIITMPIDPATGAPKVVDNSPGYYAYSQGSSIFDFYMREYAGVDPANGTPMWYQYFDDVNGNGIFDEGDTGIEQMAQYMFDNPDATVSRRVTNDYAAATNKYVGKSGIPDLRGAFRLQADWKNFNFSTQFIYSIGGYAYDAQYGELMSDRFGAAGNNFHSDIANRWQNPGDITDVPRLGDALDANATSTSTRFLTKTDFLSLNNAIVGYTLPGEWLGTTGLDYANIYVSGDNLFVKTARQGFLPNTRETGNTGRRLYAPMTTVTMGVRVKF